MIFNKKNIISSNQTDVTCTNMYKHKSNMWQTKISVVIVSLITDRTSGRISRFKKSQLMTVTNLIIIVRGISYLLEKCFKIKYLCPLHSNFDEQTAKWHFQSCMRLLSIFTHIFSIQIRRRVCRQM